VLRQLASRPRFADLMLERGDRSAQACMDEDQDADLPNTNAEAGAGALSGGTVTTTLLRRLFSRIPGIVDYRFTSARLWLLDRWLGPLPETPTDRAIREEGERLRKAFPQIDLDDPRPRTIPPAHY
jgi:hypothetical protein